LKTEAYVQQQEELDTLVFERDREAGETHAEYEAMKVARDLDREQQEATRLMQAETKAQRESMLEEAAAFEAHQEEAHTYTQTHTLTHTRTQRHECIHFQ
jgi:hydroxylamine reductase (hybrid-cluster protein)